MAPQLTATKGPSLRWLQACTARATSSLPVPDSPRTSTGAMPRATLAMRDFTSRIGSDSPTSRSSAARPVLLAVAAAARLAADRPAGRAAAAGDGLRLHGGGHHGAELLQVDRLGQVVEGAGLQRLDRVLGRAVGRHHHAALAALVLLDALQDLHAEPVGQAHVGDHGIEAARIQMLPGFGTVPAASTR